MKSPISETTPSPIVAVPTFINAIRDSGYKSPAAALAELVDNSLEAGAKHVSITIRPEPGPELRPTIAMTDDGCGMPPSVLQIALQFGGSTRFNCRIGSGRYGMGLPCGALSQARRIDLYSWQSPSSVWWTFLDATAITNGALLEVPKPKLLGRRAPFQTETSSGTVVVLSDCDRLDPGSHTASTALKQGLGRIFRRAISLGTILTINGEAVSPADPLFLDEGSSPIRGQLYGQPMEFPFKLLGGEVSTVRVRFSELPVKRLHALSNNEKASQGISKGAGVSVLRAGREVDYGWFFMGSKRKENYDDWWRCEVEFDPLLDELFGLTHTKQRVNPSQLLSTVLSPHLETVARTLNRRVRQAFQQIASHRSYSPATRLAESRDALLEPPLSTRRSRRGGPSQADGEQTPLSPITGLHYRVSRLGLPDGTLFEPELTGKTLTMNLNTDHAFYAQQLLPLQGNRSIRSSDALAPVEVLLLAFCRAEIGLHKRADKEAAKHIRKRWGDALTAYSG
jgi:hypothetical protein